MWTGGFGSSFSLQNTLQRAAPLLLTALCVAMPARLGLVVIGGEGALVLGGLMAAAVAVPLLGLPARWSGSPWASPAAARRGHLDRRWSARLRHYRGVNETISSLLMAYIAIALMNQLVEGPLRDPASLNKPSTLPIGDAYMLPAHARPGRALGPGRRRRRLHRRLAADGPHHLRLCRPHRRRQSARGHAAGPAGRQADDLGLRARRRLSPGSPA